MSDERMERLKQVSAYRRMVDAAWRKVEDIPANVESCMALIEMKRSRWPDVISDDEYDDYRAAHSVVLGVCAEIKSWSEAGAKVAEDLSRTLAAERLYKLEEKEVRRADNLYEKYRQFAERVDQLVETARMFDERFAEDMREL